MTPSIKLCACCCAALLLIAAASPAAEPESLEFFEKKIRPVLADNCFQCHTGKKKGNLRLDSREATLKGGDTGAAIVPGQPEKSLLVKAIGYKDDDLRMPPKSKLPDEAIADLTAWVKMGAPWPAAQPARSAGSTKEAFNLRERTKHWSFQSVKPPRLPNLRRQDWPQSPIDYFLLAKLEASGLSPARPADRRTLLRRVTFDLIGLPPTPAEIDAFLSDSSPTAYQKVVERLLQSPHYGERWARHWLDLVRFAETAGHEFDFDFPDAYRYRDYVIRAFNDDLPYDQFVTEHIAGDLLPNPRRHAGDKTNESILATGFWFLGEAKHSPVDIRQDEAERMDNQIDVFSKTFLGLTVSCARCHDHKFDAISTNDYYALTGYLESSRFDRAFLDPPDRLQPILNQLQHWQGRCEQQAVALAAAAVRNDLLKLDNKALAKMEPPSRPRSVLGDSRYVVFEDFAAPDYRGWFASGPAFGIGPTQKPAIFLNAAAPAAHAIVEPSVAHSGLISGKLQGALRSQTFTIAKKHIWYRAAGHGSQINLIIDNFQQIRNPIYGGLTISVNHGDHMQWLGQDVSMWVGQRAYVEFLDNGPGYLAVDQIGFSDAGPPPSEPNKLWPSVRNDPNKLRALLGDTVARWQAQTLHQEKDAAERLDLLNAVMAARLGIDWQKELAACVREIREVESRLAAPQRGLAMTDGTPWQPHVFVRGNHKTLGEAVPRRFLEALGGAAPTTAGSGRLELARCLVQPSNPFLARVMVNRLWQHHFGEGLVRSVDNFGVLGELASHPELLDFLATEFVRRGWSIKQMHRLMVLSSAYQMASRAEDAMAEERDPQNRSLHRMPIRRLEAECIRDAVLYVSGRLDLKMFGPGVMPHLTAHMAGRGRPGHSGPLDGDGRRSLYINVRRNFLTPMFLAFDYPIPFTTMGRRSVSNVPAQALTMMNNPFVVQQADLWARRTLAEPGLSPPQRLEKLYVMAFARPPTTAELADGLAFLQECGKVYEGANDPRAWTDLCHVLFNVKEFIFLQ